MASYSLNLNALRHSLVTIPKTGGAATRFPAAAPATQSGASARRGKDALSHLFSIVYPRSLVEGPLGRAPISANAGLQERLTFSEARQTADRCLVNATPARTQHCDATTAAADAALDRYHEAAATPSGDEDGVLQDVVDLSLQMDEACAIDLSDLAE